MALLWQSDALLQLHETGIGTQPIPARITVQPDQPMATPFVSLVEPGKCLIIVIQAGIHESNSIRRDILFTRHLIQANKYLPRFSLPPPLSIGIAGSCDRHNPARQVFVGLIELVEGLGVHLFLLICPAKPEMRQRKFRTYRQGLAEMTDRPVIIVSIEIIEADIGADSNGQRVQLVSKIYLLPGFVGASHCHQVVTVPIVSARIVWVELDGPLELPFRFSPIPSVIDLVARESGMP